MDTLQELVKLGLVGILAGLFTSFITNKDHRQNKWWELRITAYKELIEALSDHHYYFQNFDSEMRKQRIDVAREKELRTYYSSSLKKIRIASDSGAFLYSENVNKSLKEFMRLSNDSNARIESEENDTNTYDFFEYFDENRSFSAVCLESVVSFSKVDLQIKSSWL